MIFCARGPFQIRSKYASWTLNDAIFHIILHFQKSSWNFSFNNVHFFFAVETKQNENTLTFDIQIWDGDHNRKITCILWANIFLFTFLHKNGLKELCVCVLFLSFSFCLIRRLFGLYIYIFLQMFVQF